MTETDRLAVAVARATLGACLCLLTGCTAVPIADAGPDQSVAKRATITLDGTGSSGRDDQPVTYSWTQQSGPRVPFSIVAGKQSFTAPDVEATLVFSLVVSDGAQVSAPDSVTIVVTNQPPAANAGPDQAVPVGRTAYLRGFESSDPDGDPIEYEWTQVSGPAVTLSNRRVSAPTFTAPSTPAALAFKLVVSDGEATGEDTVAVDAVVPGGNRAPSAWAGLDQTVPRGSTVMLSSAATYDPDGDGLSYTWTQVSGTTVTLATPDAPATTFVAPAAFATMVFELTAGDGTLTDSDQVRITTVNQPPVISAASLVPSEPVTDADLGVLATVTDADGDSVSTTYAWTRNGAPVAGQTSAIFPHALTTKGDVIAVTITASDGSAAVTHTSSTTIQDAAPLLTASAPATATHCEEVSFVVAASDADGEPVAPLQLDHGPAGMSLAADGTVTWRACLPMFDATLDVHWSVVTAGTPQARTSGTIRVAAPAGHQPPLRRAGIVGPAIAGMQLSDLDADGTTDLLLVSGTAIQELGKSATGYAQRWLYPFAPPDGTPFRAAAAVNADGEARPELFFATGTLLLKLDGVTRQEVARLDTTTLGALGCRDLEVADLAADGRPELVCLAEQRDSTSMTAAVIDPVTLTVMWRMSLGGHCLNVALGNVDADPAIELVFPNGAVFDGATTQNQWWYPAGSGFGETVATGDLDGDGVEEIIANLPSAGLLAAYDAASKTRRWTFPRTAESIAVANFESDQGAVRAELLVAGAGSASAYRFEAAGGTLVEAWSLPFEGSAVAALAVGDVDADGQPELVLAARRDVTEKAMLLVAGRNDGAMQVEWTPAVTDELDAPFRGALGAHTGTAVPKLMFGVTQNEGGAGATRLISMDPLTGALDFSEPLVNSSGLSPELALADRDNDGVDEVVFGFQTTVGAYDMVSKGAPELTIAAPALIADVAASDVTGDGLPDLHALTLYGDLEVYDGRDGTRRFRAYGGYAAEMAIHDLDGDGSDELIVLTGSGLRIYERGSAGGPLYMERATVLGPRNGADDLLVADLEDDGQACIYVLYPASYPYWTAALWRVTGDLQSRGTILLPADAASLHEEAVGARRRNLLVGNAVSATRPASYLRALDPDTGALVWQSPALPGNVTRGSVSYVLLDGETVPRLVYATDFGMNITR